MEIDRTVGVSALCAGLLFDMSGKFVVYLFEDLAIKVVSLPGEETLCRKGPIARKWAIFFCASCLFLALAGLASVISCAHDASLRSGEKAVSTDAESSAGPAAGPDVESESSSSPGRNYARRGAKEAEDELERMQWENDMLREENDWLRAEVIRLQQSLLDANQTIYSLNRKLDAIFKPNGVGE